ncbi:MAG TPA: sigma-70 family RNA polymerase sigma factor [Nannocystaceae bacterium]|nr:sigma-70 family RNA polymerase sigma factor [Nannocystaceae bacterium]
MNDDVELLDAWIAGDQSAGDLLIARHMPAVRRFFDTKVPHLAEDLAQRTLLACVQARARFRRDGTFRAYLFGIARRQLLLHLREGTRADTLQSFAAAAGPDTAATPTGLIAAREEQRLVLRAFEDLSEEQQTVIQLFYWEEMTVAEIAMVLEISVTAVTSRLGRARDSMRKWVEQLELRPATRASLLADLEGWTKSVLKR